ncbi:MAG TPA: class I SAM-dependent methyltransferase [Anaerolineales bacterium]|nr:class I SAM-dependent methyltransferase [Anaerolineales bacterium]
MKSSVDEIRSRFDKDVERFSNLETGQTATIDAPLVLDLITSAAATVTPGARELLDIGCGAGNYSLKMLQALPGLNVTLVDLSRPMLDRALERVSAATTGSVTAIQGDIREINLRPHRYDLVLAAAVLHHLRSDVEWETVAGRLYYALRPGGSAWIADLITHSVPEVQALMWARYGDYLTDLKGEAYRDQVFGYIDKEDTPRSLMTQLDLLRKVGFASVELLHKNSVFAAFGGIKAEIKTKDE